MHVTRAGTVARIEKLLCMRPRSCWWTAASAQYIFNLNTKTLSAGTYKLRLDLGDGVLRTVNISLR